MTIFFLQNSYDVIDNVIITRINVLRIYLAIEEPVNGNALRSTPKLLDRINAYCHTFNKHVILHVYKK